MFIFVSDSTVNTFTAAVYKCKLNRGYMLHRLVLLREHDFKKKPVASLHKSMHVRKCLCKCVALCTDDV